MSDPVLHLLAGPNGSGKSTLFDRVIGPTTHLEFVNADRIAAERWPADTAVRSYDAASIATARREALVDTRVSFVTETVFSHGSKVDLVKRAVSAGYLVTLHVVVVPEALAVARVAQRVVTGGHDVPEAKIRERYRRLWPLVVRAIGLADRSVLYDNSRARSPFRVLATFDRGMAPGTIDWSIWTPESLTMLSRSE